MRRARASRSLASLTSVHDLQEAGPARARSVGAMLERGRASASLPRAPAAPLPVGLGQVGVRRHTVGRSGGERHAEPAGRRLRRRPSASAWRPSARVRGRRRTDRGRRRASSARAARAASAWSSSSQRAAARASTCRRASTALELLERRGRGASPRFQRELREQRQRALVARRHRHQRGGAFVGSHRACPGRRASCERLRRAPSGRGSCPGARRERQRNASSESSPPTLRLRRDGASAAVSARTAFDERRERRPAGWPDRRRAPPGWPRRLSRPSPYAREQPRSPSSPWAARRCARRRATPGSTPARSSRDR